MTTIQNDCIDHPWYLHLCPDPVREGRESDALAALKALDAIGAVILAVHADTVPSLADMIAGRSYIGWTIGIPGSVERHMIERIAATAGTGYRATIVPGHPLPPAADESTPPCRPVRPSAPRVVGRA